MKIALGVIFLVAEYELSNLEETFTPILSSDINPSSKEFSQRLFFQEVYHVDEQAVKKIMNLSEIELEVTMFGRNCTEIYCCHLQHLDQNQA